MLLPKTAAPYGVALLLVIATTGFILQAQYAAPTAYIAHDPDNLLRLHILAHSDAPADQDLKLAVRDALIPLLLHAADSGESAAEVEQTLAKQREVLIAKAEEVVRAAGKDYPVQVEFGERYFASSADQALPAGRYRAVRVLIGAAAGQNWWCVLFPPMCLAPDAVTAQAVAVGDAEGARLPVEFRTRYIPLGYLQRATQYLQVALKIIFPSGRH